MEVAMYCSSCGLGIKPTLSYRNHCGARLKEGKDQAVTRSRQVAPEFLVFGIVAAFVFGLGAIICLVGVMKGFAFEPGLINFFTMLSFLLLLAIESLFSWMLLHRHTGVKEERGAERLRDQQAKEIGPAVEQGFPDPVPSVSEHTTRGLETALPKQPTIHQ